MSSSSSPSPSLLNPSPPTPPSPPLRRHRPIHLSELPPELLLHLTLHLDLPSTYHLSVTSRLFRHLLGPLPHLITWFSTHPTYHILLPPRPRVSLAWSAPSVIHNSQPISPPAISRLDSGYASMPTSPILEPRGGLRWDHQAQLETDRRLRRELLRELRLSQTLLQIPIATGRGAGAACCTCLRYLPVEMFHENELRRGEGVGRCWECVIQAATGGVTRAETPSYRRRGRGREPKKMEIEEGEEGVEVVAGEMIQVGPGERWDDQACLVEARTVIEEEDERRDEGCCGGWGSFMTLFIICGRRR